jgi:hypothetical protein
MDSYTKISFATQLGVATNNLSEFMVVKLLLTLAKEKGISHINIFGLFLVIKCINESQTLHTYTLLPILDDIRRLLTSFTHVTFTHVWILLVQGFKKLNRGLDWILQFQVTQR